VDLKNALAVCLISLFSATLVVLIARALDSQAAARLEPQLASIVEELRAIRQQGGMAAAPGAAASAAMATKGDSLADGLVVYYFHSNTRCPTCQAIESQSHDTVRTSFAAPLARGEMVWKILNYEQRAASDLAKKFEIQMPVVVLARMKGGAIQEWKRLDEVWALVDDKAAFATYLQNEINKMLGRGAGQPSPSAGKPQAAPAANLPLPPTTGLPLPK
jgi:hypothetical protein